MIRRHRQSFEQRLHDLAPEQLLLLTIVGSRKTRRLVDTELDRRAALRPRNLHAMSRTRQLLPAA